MKLTKNVHSSCAVVDSKVQIIMKTWLKYTYNNNWKIKLKNVSMQHNKKKKKTLKYQVYFLQICQAVEV